jgi:hypothetical protein
MTRPLYIHASSLPSDRLDTHLPNLPLASTCLFSIINSTLLYCIQPVKFEREHVPGGDARVPEAAERLMLVSGRHRPPPLPRIQIHTPAAGKSTQLAHIGFIGYLSLCV